MPLFVRIWLGLFIFSFLPHFCSASQELKTDDTDEKELQNHQKQPTSSIVISGDLEQYLKTLKHASLEQANVHIRSKSSKLSEETRRIGQENYIGLLQKHVRKTSWEKTVEDNQYLLNLLTISS